MRLRLAVVGTCVLAPLLLASCGTPDTRSFSTATTCTADIVHAIVPQFIDAFNRGDLTAVDQLFSDTVFSWYSTDAPGPRFGAAAKDRSTLIPYFAARHRAHERLELTSLNITDAGGTNADFTFVLTRSADDLAATRYSGKGGIQCRVMPASIFVWSMATYSWSPIELLPFGGALMVAAIVATAVLLWRRRRTDLR
jgi:ketosteroid isomerase-like protein